MSNKPAIDSVAAPRAGCVCGELCQCVCHVHPAMVACNPGESPNRHIIPCCGEGSANHWLYCLDRFLTPEVM